MEKPFMDKSQNRLWLVIISLLLCLVLFCIDYFVLITAKNGFTNFANNFATGLGTRNSKSRNFTLIPVSRDPTYTVTSHVNKFVNNNEGNSATENNEGRMKNNITANGDSCLGRYIYIHNLPNRFNNDILKNCKVLNKWFDMCPSMENSGLGPQMENPEGVLLNKSWFSTNQFLLEVIFHNRMKQYKCLTNNSSLASAIYVPFYAGLDIGRYLWGYNTSVRDSSAFDIVKWLAERPEWKRMWGRDHFFVAGRIAWDFRRGTENNSDWGSKLMALSQSMNMTTLTIESSSWSNEFAIPYPTYFHPSSESEILQWQTKMRNSKRHYLFSFVGAPRPSNNDSVRGEIIKQCIASRGICKFLDCSSDRKICDNPVEVMKVFQNSVFCLQPPGDSYTRRSSFDSILAGCIPVFFHPGSAYAQYLWYLPKNYTKYSIFLPMNDLKNKKVSVNDTLVGVTEEEILAMRNEVIALIPKIVYADPRSNMKELEDAFSIAVKGVLERVEKVRKIMKEEKDPRIGFAEENSWELKLSGTLEEHMLAQLFRERERERES